MPVYRLTYNGDVVNITARDRDRGGSFVVRENQSRRDLTKVAQYEVLGSMF
jgi:hypothetical protein